MISDGLWTRRFGSDPAVVGRTLHINATPYTVIGVLPPGFRGLIGTATSGCRSPPTSRRS